ncbi:copper resistance protein CopC [Dyella solisilvae]|uniref:Copper resistance protein C n=1 Tax=Dyella solisilvae TaxID=1920168 RepID=A0A370K3W7_9GAMM|nr:copper resistance CopC family protein [Dyella solisilvae]RDI97341.1 copper resistance protein CopC [Dyella solisilvae]
MRRCRRFVILSLAVAAAVASVGASAHAVLLDSTPKAHGALPAGHTQVVLKYNSKIDQARSRLVLVAPDHSETTLAITADGDKPNELDSTADLKPGNYTLHWQALALDGHLTRGDLPFTVTAAP